ncbi:MAG: DUF1454 family protein [Sodalis sp. (in: enterobacteria)]
MNFTRSASKINKTLYTSYLYHIPKKGSYKIKTLQITYLAVKAALIKTTFLTVYMWQRSSMSF